MANLAYTHQVDAESRAVAVPAAGRITDVLQELRLEVTAWLSRSTSVLAADRTMPIGRALRTNSIPPVDRTFAVQPGQ